MTGGGGVFKHIGQVCERVSGRSSDPQRIVFLFLSQLNSVVACDVTDLSRGVVPGETGDDMWDSTFLYAWLYN